MQKINKFIVFIVPGLNSKFRTSVFFSALIAAVYTIAVLVKVSNEESDFIAHGQVAEDMLTGGRMPPHFLYQFLLIAIHSLCKISFIHASFVTVFFLVFVTAIVAYKNIIDTNVALKKNIIGLSVLFLLLSHPITLLFPFDQHLYYGYIASNVYHNPSILLLKFLALSHFILLCRLWNEDKNASHHIFKFVLLALLTGLTIIAKPNYIIALLPAIFILYMVKIFRGAFVFNRFLVIALSVAVPAIILLGWQYIFFYVSGNSNSIGVSFLEVYEVGSLRWTLIPKLVMSLAFPISVIIFAGSSLTKRIDFQLSACMLAISLIYSYLLVDNVGGRVQLQAISGGQHKSHISYFFLCALSSMRGPYWGSQKMEGR